MDQLKDFLRQCVKYRFWIAFGTAVLLPIIGYFVGIGGIIQAKTKSEGDITKAKKDIGNYTMKGIVNGQYQPLAAQKNAVLANDVDESWRKLRAIQEPLLRWPEEVEAKFLRWGRKFPTDVDRGEVTRTLVDYTFSYPNFVSKIYTIFKPFNYEDGTGIVVAPDEKTLLRPVAFSSDNPPELSKVWAEQERIWVVTALLDAIARINDSVKATNWDTAIVKQINLIEVGSMSDQDQKSVAEGIELAPADQLLPDGAPAPVAAAPSPMTGPGGGGMPGSAGASDEVYYLKNASKQFKTLPIKLVALVEQAKVADFLVGLENSPITIQVMETEVARPSAPVQKPEVGEKTGNPMGMATGRMGGDGNSGPNVLNAPGARNANRGPGSGRMNMNGPGGPGGPMGRGGPGGPGGGTTKGGVDGRSVNKAQERKNAEKEANKAKGETKVKPEQHFNIVEVTVYGQARFYLAPPPAPVSSPSTAAAAPASPPAPEKAKAEPTNPAPEPKKDETPKPVDASKSEEGVKKDEAAKPEEPKTEAPTGEAPKAEAPKAEVPKAEAPKSEPPK